MKKILLLFVAIFMLISCDDKKEMAEALIHDWIQHTDFLYDDSYNSIKTSIKKCDDVFDNIEAISIAKEVIERCEFKYNSYESMHKEVSKIVKDTISICIKDKNFNLDAYNGYSVFHEYSMNDKYDGEAKTVKMRFIIDNSCKSVLAYYEYLNDGEYQTRPSVRFVLQIINDAYYSLKGK